MSNINYGLDESLEHDLEVQQKLTDITDINRLIKKHATYFKTHFIKYNENKKDKILTEEITKIVMVLNQHGFKYIAKDHSEIEGKIKNSIRDFDNIRAAKKIRQNQLNDSSLSLDDTGLYGTHEVLIYD